MDYPSTGKSVVIVLAALIGVFAVYYTLTLAGAALGLALLAVLAYGLWVVGVRINNWAKGGRLVPRRRSE